MKDKTKILLIAGEASGDLHGASLISELKKNNSSFSFYGIGGEKMRAEGLRLIEHINNMAFLGFAEVVKHLPQIMKTKKAVLELVKREEIGTAILIDYPGFNLNIAKKLKEEGVKVIYYITPQVWAWGKGRVKAIKELITKVLVILPFEKEFFRKHGIDAEYVGHPLIERIDSYSFPERNEFYRLCNLDPGKGMVVILPGSRKQEVAGIFPESVKAADMIAKEFGLQVVVACSENINEDMFKSFKKEFDFRLITGKTYELLRFSECGIVKSGTSTLEAALIGLPMVIVYKTNPVTYFIGKNIVNLKNIGLVNIISGESIVPELIQDEMNANRIYSEIKKYLTDEVYNKSVRLKLNKVKSIIGNDRASANAASQILNVMGYA